LNLVEEDAAVLKGRDFPHLGTVLVVQGLHHEIAIRAKPRAGIGVVAVLISGYAFIVFQYLLTSLSE
jgi:hypothetical protein